MSPRAQRTDSNPFSSRWVRPGAIPYLFPSDATVQTLVERLLSEGGWGQIVGPHGSGKSTLLVALLPELRHVGFEALVYPLHGGSRRLPRDWQRQIRSKANAILVIDSYEQLPRLARLWIKCLCRRMKCGLFVTAHQDVGLPDVFRTAVTNETSQRVVVYLNKGRSGLVSPEEIAGPLQVREGNLREALFDLYDVYESRRRQVTSAQE